jgi:hypothetical protein
LNLAWLSVAAVQGAAASTDPGQATMLRFDAMTPVGWQAAVSLGAHSRDRLS